MNRIFKNISFTKNETKIIFFIIFVLTAGFAVKYYKQIFYSNSASSYDFTRSDSVFKSRSNFIQQNDSLPALNDSISILKAGEENLTDINTAGKNELTELPGIGESIALKIIDYREKNTRFKNIEELMNVSGIGRKKFEKLKNYIKTK